VYDDYEKTRFHDHIDLKTLTQEHGKAVADDPSQVEGKFRIGDKVRILENHSCLTVANFDEYHVVRGTEVIGKWKIVRGRT
jgi:D-serine deaminase-like pyridoxal phosphate-dependent protein